MSNAAADPHREPPHVALFPTAGMGHLNPLLRLAAMLSTRGCTVTLITATPTLTAAESTHISTFFSTHPQINRLDYEIPTTEPAPGDDPCFTRWHEISRSAHLLRPLLSCLSPPLSAIFSDFALAMCVSPIADDLRIQNYFVFISCARFLALVTCLPTLVSGDSTQLLGCDKDLDIPGLSPLPMSYLPLPFFNPNHQLTSFLASNARVFAKAKGLLLNTFDRVESETITALNNGSVLSCLAPVIPIGPFEPYDVEKGNHPSWLDDQIAGSVVFVCFGSRASMSKEQIRELGDGLERSGCAFCWVLKGSKEDKEGREEELLGESFIERTKNRGVVVKGWVNQEEILAHPATGGFVSHCGWNSLMEAARYGLPVLAWPPNGDHKVSAEVVEKAGMGIWVKDWGWGGERLVRGEEIGEKVREMMSEKKLRDTAREIGEEARKVFEADGSSEKALMGIIEKLKPT